MTEEFNTALNLIRALNRRFPGTESLIVGGAVRDRILNIDAHDVDIATNIPFDKLAQAFDLNDITKNTVNAQPVSIINFCGFAFEIAAFRTDSWGVEGRANNVSTLTSRFQDDALRRDITINALGIDEYGNTVDFVGGKQDLHDRVIRAVGNPDSRFREDATRILRVLRFAAKFGFSIEFYTANAIQENAWRLTDRAQISPESIAKEFYKAASNGPQLARFIELLVDFNLINVVLPEWSALDGFFQDPQHHPEFNGNVQGHILACLYESYSRNPVTNLAILFHDLGKAVTQGIKPNGCNNYHGHEEAGVPITQGIFDRLKFNDLSHQDKENILYCVSQHMLVHKIEELSVKRLAKLVLHDGWDILIDVSFADDASRCFNVEGQVFDRAAYFQKINAAEAKVENIASNNAELRLRVKAYVDGNVLQEWFPEFKENIKVLKPVLEELADHILNELNAGVEPNIEELKEIAKTVAAGFDEETFGGL